MRAILLALTLSLAGCASVQGVSDQPPPFQAPAPTAPILTPTYQREVDLPAGTYRLDPRHASVTFRIRHMDLSWFTARFDDIDATFELDPSDPSGSQLTASVGVQSVNTGVLSRSGERIFDRQIAGVLGAETTPRISLVTTQILRTGEHTALVNADLTMNGQTHGVSLDVTFGGATIDPLRGGAQVLGFSAHGTINRSDWGVTQWRAFTGDEVQIVIEAELVKT